MSPSGKAAAVGVLMASFLVWLWLYDAGGAEDEVSGWLEQHGLAHLRRYSPFRRVSSLEELARLDLDSLPPPLQYSSSLPALQQGLQLLELRLWLREGDMEELLPQLVAAGHSSRQSLLALGPYDIKKLCSQLQPAELWEIFRERLRHDTTPTAKIPTSTSVLWAVLYTFLSFIFAVVLCIFGLIMFCVWVVLSETSSGQQRVNMSSRQERVNVGSGQEGVNGENLRLRGSPWLSEILSRMNQAPRTRDRSEEEEERFSRSPRDMSGGALDPNACRLEWSHDDCAVVGTPSAATLTLVRRNFAPYELQPTDRLKITVTNTVTGTLVPHVVKPAPPTGHAQLRLSFSTRTAGTYSLHVQLNGQSLAGTPINRTFTPVERGSWGVLRMLEDCLRSLLRPPPRRDQQDRGGVASPTHSPSGSGTSDEQDKTPECDPRRCRLEWNQDDRAPVGGASVVTLHLVSRDSAPYKMRSCDTLRASIRHTSKTLVPHAVEPTPPIGHAQLRLSFSTRTAGTYSLHVQLNGQSLAGTPINRTFTPGTVDPGKTSFPQHPQWLVLTAGTYHSMTVLPRDCYGNAAIIQQEHLTVNIRKGGPEGELVNPECVVERVPNTSQYELLLKVETPGHYIASVLYQGRTIGPPQFTIISLTPSETGTVDKNLTKRTVNLYYEASVAASDGRHKKVYFYLFPKQLQVREYYLKFIPYRLYTCKVCPSTSIHMGEEEGAFTVDDGYQPPISLISKQREIIAATYYKFLLKNIGGSEQFQDKRKFFNSELKSHHRKEPRGERHLHIDRFDLLQSAMRETKGFSASDWRKTFTVSFLGEEALDWGGVSREFFHLLCTQCFNCSNGMFRRFKDDPQALVHPNPHHPPSITPHHYHFAGRLVGKCLYESAMGTNLYVSARFTRSFLAQIIGLRINYKYFESDDPDLYVSKIQYIRENSVSDLELLFAEEEFSDDGTVQVVPLEEGGEKKPVTEENKTHYLNLLAQHRLAGQTKTQVEHFVKAVQVCGCSHVILARSHSHSTTGLHDLIPDNLLGIFDENELELLMCGTDTVSYDDLKRHAVVAASANPHFQRVVSWFWLVVSGFTREEMARLLQFVTGSSQLPPGGFKDLSPKFQITSAPTHGRLPSAHTCFNQLCLPEYDSCEQFQTALTLALNEGTEGFGFL